MRRIVRPLSTLAPFLLLISFDSHLRYSEIGARILGSTVLEIGSGGQAFLRSQRKLFVSLDVKPFQGVDIVASADNLPFRGSSFDTVVAADVIEHLRREARGKMLEEMIRVAGKEAVLHCPLQGGEYHGRDADISFNRWIISKGRFEKNTQEHIDLVEPYPDELKPFILQGTPNALFWLRAMKISFALPWPVGVFAANAYAILRNDKYKGPPYWGAIGIFVKDGERAYNVTDSMNN